MSDDFLSQDEVDALLSGTDDSADEGLPENDTAEQETANPYPFVNRERLIPARMPAMEAANERFGRELRTAMSTFVRRAAEVSIGEPQIQSYSEFIDALELPCSLTIVKVNPLRGNGLLVCESALVFALIETLFGGRGKLESSLEGRGFSPTEISVTEALIQRIAQAYQSAWKDSYPLSLEVVRLESQPRRAQIARDEDGVVTLRCMININGLAGAFHLCIPYATLDPIRSTLYSTVNKDQLCTDPIWTERLGEQLSIAELELTAKLADTELTFGELIALQKGDFIELDLAEQIEVLVRETPFLSCHYGTNQGRYAIKLDHFLTPTENVLNGVTDDRSA